MTRRTDDGNQRNPQNPVANGFESLSDYIQNHLEDDTDHTLTLLDASAYAEEPLVGKSLMGFGAQRLYQAKNNAALRKGGQLYSTDAKLAETHYLKQFSNESLRLKSLKREYGKALAEVTESLSQYETLADQSQPQLQQLRVRQQHLQLQIQQLDLALNAYNPFQAFSHSPLFKLGRCLAPLNRWWAKTMGNAAKQELKQHHQQFKKLQQLLSQHLHSPNELPPELLEQLLIEYDRQMSRAETLTELYVAKHKVETSQYEKKPLI
jgi:hypothetical protein